jgi:hypothetical protein
LIEKQAEVKKVVNHLKVFPFYMDHQATVENDILKKQNPKKKITGKSSQGFPCKLR